MVAVPAGGREWLVSLAEAGGEPVVVHAVREAVSLGLPTRIVADVDAVDSLGLVLAEAGLGQVVVVARPAGGATLAAVADDSAAAVLVHDPLCPLTPAAVRQPALVTACPDTSVQWRPVVAVRPMTDTVKVVRDGHVAATVDRNALRVAASPVVVPPGITADLLENGDVPALVADLRRRADPELLPAPPLARRVADRSDLQVVLALRDLEERDA